MFNIKVKSVASMCLVATGLLALPVLANDDPLSILPPDAMVRKTFEKIPQLRAGNMGINLAGSQKSRLEAGHYEWTARVGISRRTDQFGERFREQEFALERPIRWFGKADKDRAIGDKGIEIAKASYADQWHETSRALLKDWFEVIRENFTQQQLRQQLDIAEQLNAIAIKRVKAGDAAKFEQLFAETELQRVRALLQQTEQRVELAIQALQANYPGLSVPVTSSLPQPINLNEQDAKSTEHWLDKIMEDNHELELAQAEAEYVGLQAARIDQDKMPDPSLGIRSSRERDGQERVLGFTISMPFPGAARSSERSAASTKAQIANEKLQQVQTKVKLMARQAITDSQRTYTTWKTLESLRQQSLQQANLMQTAYRLGEVGITDALNTRKMALDAAIAADTAQIDALAAYARLHLDAHLIWALD